MTCRRVKIAVDCRIQNFFELPVLSNLLSKSMLVVLIAFVAVLQPDACLAQKASGRISVGGLQRFKGGQWGLVQGQFTNESDEDQSVTAVVTQKEGTGAQFARTIDVPAHMTRNSHWPVFVEKPKSTNYEFDHMVIEEENGRETIARRYNEQIVNSFVVLGVRKPLVPKPGYCGHLFCPEDSEEGLEEIEQLMDQFRTSAGLPTMVSGFRPNDLHGYVEALGPLDQLTISASDLWRFPDTCDIVRMWIQRGGRALLMLDMLGERSAKALLGDALPLTFVDKTNPQQLHLKHHRYGNGLEVDLSYDKLLDEPVPMIRAFNDRGIVHWSHDGWPILIEVPVGHGTVLVSTVPATVYLAHEKGQEFAACGDIIFDDLFRSQPPRSLLDSSQITELAESRIGYSIPGRQFPLLVLGGFMLCLAVVGAFLTSRKRQGLMLIVVPVCSLIALLPGLATGMAARNSAPPTLIETRIIQAPPGQTVLAADGFSTIYLPDSTDLELSLNDSTSLLADSSRPNRDRLVWTDAGKSSWPGFSQPAGSTTYKERSILRLESPLKAMTTFGEDGVTVSISNPETLQPEDVLIASPGVDRLAPQKKADGDYFAGPSDVVALGKLNNATLVSTEQVMRNKFLQSIFQNEDRVEPFLSEPSVLFWTAALPPAVSSDSAAIQQEASTLIVLPLEFLSPQPGQPVTIPSPLLPYTSVADETDSVSPAFGNRSREWIQRKRSGSIVLRFVLPTVCRPFRFEHGLLQLRIRAGSRSVRIQAGRVGDFHDVTTLSSPVGSFDIELPADAMNATDDSGFAYVKLDVGDLDIESDDDVDALTEQDNFWLVERLQLTVKGHREATMQKRQPGKSDKE